MNHNDFSTVTSSSTTKTLTTLPMSRNQQQQEQIDEEAAGSIHRPRRGYVDSTQQYYCTKNNDTCRKLESLLGCFWYDLAQLNEMELSAINNNYNNNTNNPKIQIGRDTKFKAWTMLRIPPRRNSFMVQKLIDPLLLSLDVNDPLRIGEQNAPPTLLSTAADTTEVTALSGDCNDKRRKSNCSLMNLTDSTVTTSSSSGCSSTTSSNGNCSDNGDDALMIVEKEGQRNHEDYHFDQQHSHINNKHPSSTSTKKFLSSQTLEQQQRRSGRERTSTIIHIDGHPVLKDNNYEVIGGSYSYGKTTSSSLTASVSGNRKRKSFKTTSTKTIVTKQPICQSENVKHRYEHNTKIKARKQQKSFDRQAYMAKHFTILEPFLDEKVKQSMIAFTKKYSILNDLDELQQQHEQQHAPTVSCPKQTTVNVQPDLVRAEMRDYQLLGLNWMVNMHRQGLPMILGDEMGLGKTLQTLSLLCYLRESEGVTGPSLVICPLSVLYSWCNEITKWTPDLKFLRFHSSDEKERVAQRAALMHSPLTYDVIVTTYEMAKNPSLSGLWRSQYFNYVILDEGHIIKDSTTQVSEAVRKLHYENTMILTGTPLQNNLVELWSILNYMYPSYFAYSERFAGAFDIRTSTIDRDTLTKARAMLNLFMLRRLKVEVEKMMPKKIETKVLCPLSSLQAHWYKGLLMKDIDTLVRASDVAAADEDSNEKNLLSSQKSTLAKPSYTVLNNLVMQLRKCCNHPFLFEGAESSIEETTIANLIAASGKLAVLDKLLRSLFLKGHRTVIFSQFTKVLDILDDYCNMRGWKYCRFDGSTARAKRNYIINKFNAPESEDFVFLMSTRSGGMGINLQTADTCILFDSDWNPQPDIQAMARVHRIGQTKTVHVYRLVCGGSVEERILQTAEKKLFLDQMVNGSAAGDVEQGDGAVAGRDLIATLLFGANAVFGSSSGRELPSEDDIHYITDRTRTESTTIGKLKGGVAKKTDDFDAGEALSSTTQFGGMDFRSLRDAQKREKKAGAPTLRNISSEWFEGKIDGKRNRKSRLVQIDGKGSGYGKTFVPVLASNNYELTDGESSVFNRELRGRTRNYVENKSERPAKVANHQSFCQVCGRNGDLMECMACPVSFHSQCAGPSVAYTKRCSHHKCMMCGKSFTSAGGILFSCQSCPNAFCEDCLPQKGVQLIGSCPRFELMGFNSANRNCYIHCSPDCETCARDKFKWSPQERNEKTCPQKIDVSYAFHNDSNKT